MKLPVSRRNIIAFVTAALLLAMVQRTQAQDDADTAARVNFAAHVSEMAQNWLAVNALNAPLFEQSAAMLRAAMTSDPHDTRYPRLLASADQQLRDVDGELAAWNAYRRLVPTDRVAEAKVIELYTWKMQTADEKLKYLQGLLAKESLPVEVRAHLASLCVPLLLDRSNDEAIQMVSEGIKLYPLPELLEWQYKLVAQHGTPVDRIAGLLQLMRSNPIQPVVMDAIARELAGQGMAGEASEWFTNEISLSQRMGIQSDPDFFLNLTSELYQAGQPQAAQDWISKVLNVERDNVAFWFMQLTLQRGSDRTGMIESADMTRDVLLRRWNFINNQIINGKDAAPATQPAPGAVPDPMVALAKLRVVHDPQLNEGFAVTLEDMAWFALFFENSPKSAAPFLHALQESLPADDATLLRLEGWYLAETGKEADARAKLVSAADRDAFAAIGLIRMDRKADPLHTRDKLRQLLTKYPTGLVAAVIHEALLSEDAPRTAEKPTTAPAAIAAPPATMPAAAPGTDTATVDAIRAELKKFPTSWLALIDQPRLFYTVAADSLQTIVHFGDPLMARVTLTNTSDHDLVIGFGGPIAPSLWVDATVSGIAQEQFQGVAFDQITGPIVLKSHGTTSQIIRVDQGTLGELIRQRPNGSMTVLGNIMTNPTRFNQGFAPGAAGEYMTFGRTFVREPSELETAAAQRDLHDDFTDGAPNDRIRDLDLMASFVSGMDKEADQALRDSSDLFIHYITKARADASPEVAALAGYLAATLPGIPGRTDTVGEMLHSAAWQTRLLGLAAIRQQPADVQQRLCAPLADADPDPVVKLMANGLLDATKLPAATQPATALTTAPAN